MRILVAEDDPVTRRLLEHQLTQHGYEVQLAEDGEQAWQLLNDPDPPPLALLDWVMPRIDGIDLCRRARARTDGPQLYIIILTVRGGTVNIVEGLEAGADDYITKPFAADELRVRVKVGQRIVELQQKLADRVRDLEKALLRVKQLQGHLPLCVYGRMPGSDPNLSLPRIAEVKSKVEKAAGQEICPECLRLLIRHDPSSFVD